MTETIDNPLADYGPCTHCVIYDGPFHLDAIGYGTTDGKIRWEGYGLRAACDCHIRVYEHDVARVVIASDAWKGASIQYAVDWLTAAVCYNWGIPQECLIWIEHFPARLNRFGGVRVKETFALVRFDMSHMDGRHFPAVHWEPVTREAVEALIGQPFPSEVFVAF